MGRFSILIFAIFLGACVKQSDKILADRDYDTGDDWLLVNVNYVENTMFIIDNEDVLRNNSDGINVLPHGQCGETTCDGFLRLYRDGLMVEDLACLDNTGLYESADLASNYIKVKSWTIKPFDKKAFDLKWDSVKRIKGLYPTVYRAQPADKDIIVIYEPEM